MVLVKSRMNKVIQTKAGTMNEKSVVTIGENLQRLIKIYGSPSINDLAKSVGVPQPTLHHIIEGKTKKPRQETLEALAKYFSISISQLLGEAPLTSIPDTIKDRLKISTVPIINWDLAKNWKREGHDISQYNEILLDKQIDKDAFALQLQDESMEPLFQEKSILIFDPSKNASDRDFVLVYLSKQDSIIFNRLFIEGKSLYIKQTSKEGSSEKIELTKLMQPHDRIIATLIEARLQF